MSKHLQIMSASNLPKCDEMKLIRHCERSDVSAVAQRAKAEAIRLAVWIEWIASSPSLLATTAG
jgi:hypothetical protein